jgi:ABC-type nitrate/sulfonate/bicarbonate transport system ATPase subunit
MRRRLALITVLATRSQLFLLDEPFSGSDYDICLDLYETIHNTFQEGTFLFTTHDMDEAALLAHRVLCLDVRVASACMIHEIVCPQSLYNQSPQARRNSFAEFAQSIRSVLDTIRPPRPATTAQPERTLLGEGCELMPH